jgi:hypothetical protein
MESSRKKIAKFLMRTFACRSTFLYATTVLYIPGLGYSGQSWGTPVVSKIGKPAGSYCIVYTRNNNPPIKGQSHESSSYVKV